LDREGEGERERDRKGDRQDSIAKLKSNFIE
jgi:hypothetical protein